MQLNHLASFRSQPGIPGRKTSLGTSPVGCAESCDPEVSPVGLPTDAQGDMWISHPALVPSGCYKSQVLGGLQAAGIYFSQPWRMENRAGLWQVQRLVRIFSLLTDVTCWPCPRGGKNEKERALLVIARKVANPSHERGALSRQPTQLPKPCLQTLYPLGWES